MRKFSALANDSGHGSLPADAQAHNLKVIGSNPLWKHQAPAGTRVNPKSGSRKEPMFSITSLWSLD
jgi:hypothetical protein